jgi:hypothetical protein
VWALGRRSGKTTLAALVGLCERLLRPELARHVRPGERRHAVAVATNLRQARLFGRTALSIVERSPLLSRLIESETEDELPVRQRGGALRVPVFESGASACESAESAGRAQAGMADSGRAEVASSRISSARECRSSLR